jgi:hypothetical protein
LVCCLKNIVTWPTACLSKFSLVTFNFPPESLLRLVFAIPCGQNFSAKNSYEHPKSIRHLRQVDFRRFANYKKIMSEPMSNFTPRAQQVLALARKEADRFHHNYVGTEHLLLGLINLGQGVAVNVL